VEYQESFRLPNNNIGSQGGREDERQTITLLKPLVNVQPPYIYSSGRLPNFFPSAKKMVEIDSLATCKSFLSLPFQVC
jgi:hypothetical protein